MRKDNHVTVAVVGAGLAGLTCARRLSDAGFQVRVFDKGRGLGGRLASRRAEGGLRFDHGAPYVESEDPVFLRVLEEACMSGQVARMTPPGKEARFVGVPGMSSLVRPLSEGLYIRNKAEVRGLGSGDGQWTVSFTEGSPEGGFDLLVLTIPAPQAEVLVADNPMLVAALSTVDFDPCWALLAAFDEPVSVACGQDAGLPDSLTKITVDSDKPGRSLDRGTGAEATSLVAHASPLWSRSHLEEDKGAIARLLLAEIERATGTGLPDPVYLAAHRWRFARTRTALGRPFLASQDERLFIGGDWCLGSSAEHAFASGAAIAEAVVGQTADRRRTS